MIINKQVEVTKNVKLIRKRNMYPIVLKMNKNVQNNQSQIVFSIIFRNTLNLSKTKKKTDCEHIYIIRYYIRIHIHMYMLFDIL